MDKIRVRNGYLFLLVLLLLGGGSTFYMIVEDWPFLDALYFCVVTLATVGYGDFVPQTSLGKIFTMFYIVVGISVFLFFVNNLARAYGERIRKNHLKKSKKIKK